MQVETLTSDHLARYLDLSTAQAKLAAANMANIDTPGYKAVGMNFESEMRRAMADVLNENPAEPVRLTPVENTISRPDGNNVSMDREGLTLAEAQLKFRTGVALMRVENQRVMDAIHASDK